MGLHITSFVLDLQLQFHLSFTREKEVHVVSASGRLAIAKKYINSEILLNPSVHYHIHTTISSRQEDIMMICPMQFSKTFKLLAVSGAQFGIMTFQFN